MNFIKACCFSVLLLAASACSVVSSLTAGPQAFPPLDPGKGRVFLYRGSTFGSENTPDVLLNGEKVVKLDRSSVFFRDVLPGSYAVTTTMTSRVVHFAVGAGEKKYVKFDNSLLGAHTYPELVDSARGESEAATLSLMNKGGK